MKKILIVSLSIFTLLFSACNGNKADDGVGTTSQRNTTTRIEGHPEYASERDPVKAVKINGYIYYELDEDGEISPGNSSPDGNFIKNASGFELPISNNESNFSDGAYYVGLTEDTLRIPIEDDVEIFCKIPNNEGFDPANYKYIMKLEGRTTHSVYEEKYIVLTNDINTTVSDAAERFYNSSAYPDGDIHIVRSFANDD